MFMTDAMEVTLLSFLSICAGVTFHLDDAQIASISSAVFAGQIVGSLFWGPVADRYGRRTAFLLACGLMTVGGVLSGLSPNFESLVIFRALVRPG
jgi:MFS family permease